MTALEWLEAWAKARGYWRAISHPPRSGWCVCFIAADRVHITTPGGHHYDLTPLVAWLWAHVVDTAREVRRRCPDCVKGIQWRSGSMSEPSQRWVIDEHGWRCVPVAIDPGLAHHEAGVGCVWWRPCPTCSTKGPHIECECCDGKGGWQHPSSWDGCRACDSLGTVAAKPRPLGYISRPLARVVCEGATRPITLECRWCEGGGGFQDDDEGWRDCSWCDGQGTRTPERGAIAEPGDPTARTELLAAAYGLLVEWTDEERAKSSTPAPIEQPKTDTEEPCTINKQHENGSNRTHGPSPTAQQTTAGHGSGPRATTQPSTANSKRSTEPAEAHVLRDYLETLGKTQADLTPEIALASGCKPHGVLGQAIALWLSEAPCEACKGRGVEAVDRVLGGLGTAPSHASQPRRLCKPCHGHGTALAAYVAKQIKC